MKDSEHNVFSMNMLLKLKMMTISKLSNKNVLLNIILILERNKMYKLITIALLYLMIMFATLGSFTMFLYSEYQVNKYTVLQMKERYNDN